MSKTSKWPSEAVADQAERVLKMVAPWEHPVSHFMHHRILPGASYAPWYNDSEFLALYPKIQKHTMVDFYRLYELWRLAKQVEKIDGDILEVGVWRGGSGAVLAKAAEGFKSKKVYLADTFTGVVKSGEKDSGYKGGEHADTSVEIVRQLMQTVPLNNIQLLQGVFPDETAGQVAGKIALLHCDVDVYNSARDIVDWAIPRMTVGALLVFDDYGFYSCDGITTYCNELSQRKDMLFIHNLNGHALFVKIS